MAAFYGTLAGIRQAKTCTGTKSSGIKAAAQSYDGSIISSLDYRTDDGGKDELRVRVGISDGSSSCADCSAPEFAGTFEDFKNLLKLADDIRSGRASVVRHRIKKGGESHE